MVFDTIKVAYNWIGPRGPIINTELPSILNMASVMNNTQVLSSKFWTEITWDRLFKNNSRFQLAPVVSMTDTTRFVYPLLLGWRINFSNYFSIGEGILEFAHTPDHIVNHVRNNLGYFLIDHSIEAFMNDNHLNAMHGYFTAMNIPLNKVIYLTGCMNADAVYSEYCDRYNIATDPKNRLSLISFPSGLWGISNVLNQSANNEPKYAIDTIPSKTFLSWNRRHRLHRSMLALCFNKHDLLEKSYFSMGLKDPEFLSNNIEDTFPVHRFDMFGIHPEDIASLTQRLPLTIDDETDPLRMCQDPGFKTRRYYTDSLLSLVTETNFETNEITLTEKSFKPIREKHPFIIVGVNGSLKAMHRLGFKTFNQFFDESYDDIVDPWVRMDMIVRLCQGISIWDDNRILDFKRGVKSILDHNYDIAKNNTMMYASSEIAMLVGDNV